MTYYRKEVLPIIKSNPELQKFRQKRLCKVCLKMLFAGLAILALTAYLYYKTSQIASIVIGIVACLFAVYKIADPRKNFSRQYGSVSKIFYFQKRANNKNGLKFSYTAMMDVTTLIVTVKSPSGRKKNTEMSMMYKNVIREGDIILFLPSVPYPINRTPGEMVLCPYCGNVMPLISDVCVGCSRKNIYPLPPQTSDAQN